MSEILVSKWNREAFRRFIAGLTDKELLEAILDINVMLDYKDKKVQSYLNHEEFSKKMRGEW